MNHELIGGIGNDRVAFEMLKKLYRVDGVIGSNVSKLNQMQHMGLETIFRISLIDSHSVEMALRSLKGDDAVLTPLPIDDEISSLSAILLNEAYYELLKTGQLMVDGIPVLSPTCLIPFKAKAWLDLKERKLNGEQVDSKNIKKHKNDVFRLSQLITANTR